MALLSYKQFCNEDLEEKWECIGSGGFGNVYKTKWKTSGLDVAIKLGYHCTGSIAPSASREAKFMDLASCNYVLKFHGIYKGCPPGIGTAIQEGILMEFMERGTVETLQKDLSGPPPWSLAFRLAHQIALGMNFLHSLKIVHQDLKPSNILLDDGLNAKLADFGLSRVSTSGLKSNTAKQELVGGTEKYMPPEAFETSYKPVRTFDIYSYGILLWSILNGEEPFPDIHTCALLEIGIRRGDRPPVEELERKDVKGLQTLVELMKKCWDGEASMRPLFSDIITCTDQVFSDHEEGVPNAVREVLELLGPKTSSQDSQSWASSFALVAPGPSMSDDVVDHPIYAKKQTPVSVNTKVLTKEEKAKFVDSKMPAIVQNAAAVDAIVDELKSKGMIHNEAYSRIINRRDNPPKVRMIYDLSLRPGGIEVKAAFYNALENHEPFLIKMLDV